MTSLSHHRAFSQRSDEEDEEMEDDMTFHDADVHVDSESTNHVSAAAESPSEDEENENDDSDLDDDGYVTPEQISSVREMKIKFDIIDSKFVEDAKQHKYTVYMILVMETSGLDADQVIIERRYSEFDQLNKGLCEECPSVMRKVPFPKKKLFSKKFKSMVVEDRSRTFEKYLRCIYNLEGVNETQAFQDFFFTPHLRQATQHLKSQDHEKSFEEYRLARELQKKLRCPSKETKIITMCGIVETSKKMEIKDYELAEKVGEECLNLMLYDITDPFLLGLMESVIDAKKRLNKPTEHMKAKMKECLKKCSYEKDSIQSLKVLLVKKF